MAEQAGMKLIQAAAVIDAAGVHAAPGSLLLEGNTVLGAGPPESIGVPSQAEIVDEPGAVLLPAMVNAHAHLDLSALEPRPFPGHFESWLESIRELRMSQQERGSLLADTRLGIDLSLAGGVAFAGDIAGAGQLDPMHALRDGPLGGISFIECFGLGDRQEASIERMRSIIDSVPGYAGGVRVGISPHAPYSCGPAVYDFALAAGLPVTTHLAESLEEEEVLFQETGPFRELAERLDAWNEGTVMPRCHPVEAMRSSLEHRPILLVHLNYIEDEHVELLAQTGARVAYCPRASDYFGHPHAGRAEHRYRQMLDAGVTVALGTDSRTCLDTLDRIGVLDEMRHLFIRDGADPMALLAMATIHGARALELEESLVTFEAGPVGGVIAVDVPDPGHPDPLAAVLRQRSAPRWVVAPAIESRS